MGIGNSYALGQNDDPIHDTVPSKRNRSLDAVEHRDAMLRGRRFANIARIVALVNVHCTNLLT